MPKPSKQIIIDAIIKEIEQGKATDKICAAICRKFQFSERTFYNHLKIAVIQHETKQDAIKKELAELDKQAAIEARKKAIMTADEKKEELSTVCNDLINKIQGKKKFTFFQGGKVVQSHNGEIFMLPIDTQVKVIDTIKGIIAELNKMCGDYAPNQVGHTFNNPLPLTATKEEIKKIANALDNIV